MGIPTLACFSRWAALALLACLWSSLAAASDTPHYVITNNDMFASSFAGVSFYTLGSAGVLVPYADVPTGGGGIQGGFFGASRLAIQSNGSGQCVFMSQGFMNEILGIDITNLEISGSASGSPTDDGSVNGIGLAMNAQYLYASFTTSNTIATFQVQPGCNLSFVNDVSVAGLQGGFIDGMALHGNTLVAAYGDGSIESFDISSGTPVSNGDKQNSTAAVQSAFASYPTSVEITKDGHYALFGDTSTSTLVEVSDISAGKLAKTVPYTVGNGINSSNIVLSPDETLLYIANTQGDSITAAFFNAITGKLSPGCQSGMLNGYVANWSYLGSLAVETNSGTGGVVYVGEFGSASGIAMVGVTSANGQCTLKESSGSPVADPNSQALLSIGMYPPRSF